MNAKITFSRHFSFPEGFKKDLKDVIEWKKAPNMIITGRSGYTKLDGTLPQSGIHLVKLKGLGFFDAQNNTAIKPGQSLYHGGKQVNDLGITELANRLIVRENGQFEIEDLTPKPFGGQFFPRVEIEFETAEETFQPEKPLLTWLPIAKAVYEDLDFEGRPLGVTVLGLPSPNLTLLEEYFIFRLEGDRIMVGPRLNPHAGPVRIFETLAGFCHQIGTKLRLLHKYRVGMEGHLANCTVIPETGEVLLHDLDYVRPVKKLSAVQEFNYRIRDLTSYLVAIITNILFSDLLTLAPQLKKHSANYFQFNFLKALLSGYESALPEKLEDLMDETWKDVLGFYIDELQSLDGKQRLIHLHPFIVDQKIYLLNDLHVLMGRVFTLEGKKISYPEKAHRKNLQKLVNPLKKPAN